MIYLFLFLFLFLWCKEKDLNPDSGTYTNRRGGDCPTKCQSELKILILIVIILKIQRLTKSTMNLATDNPVSAAFTKQQFQFDVKRG